MPAVRRRWQGRAQSSDTQRRRERRRRACPLGLRLGELRRVALAESGWANRLRVPLRLQGCKPDAERDQNERDAFDERGLLAEDRDADDRGQDRDRGDECARLPGAKDGDGPIQRDERHETDEHPLVEALQGELGRGGANEGIAGGQEIPRQKRDRGVHRHECRRGRRGETEMARLQDISARQQRGEEEHEVALEDLEVERSATSQDKRRHPRGDERHGARAARPETPPEEDRADDQHPGGDDPLDEGGSMAGRSELQTADEERCKRALAQRQADPFEPRVAWQRGGAPREARNEQHGADAESQGEEILGRERLGDTEPSHGRIRRPDRHGQRRPQDAAERADRRDSRERLAKRWRHGSESGAAIGSSSWVCRFLVATAYAPGLRSGSTLGLTMVAWYFSQSAAVNSARSPTNANRPSASSEYMLRWIGCTWSSGSSWPNRIGNSVRVSRTLVKSGPNHRSVSTMPSNSSYLWLRGRFAGGRTRRLQPGRVVTTWPVQIWRTPGSGRALRNGGENPLIPAGAMSSK